MTKFDSSELIFYSDNSIFHLHLSPEQLAVKVVLVDESLCVEMIQK